MICVREVGTAHIGETLLFGVDFEIVLERGVLPVIFGGRVAAWSAGDDFGRDIASI